MLSYYTCTCISHQGLEEFMLESAIGHILKTATGVKKKKKYNKITMSPLGPQKVKNYPNIKSKSKVKNEKNIENVSCLST